MGIRIAVTGHRPNKLWGYDYSHPSYVNMRNYFKTFLKNANCEVAISGMALGVDTVFALAVLDLKEEGYPIKLLCALPCLNQDCKWVEESRVLYHKILGRADEIAYITQETYTPECMQKRNEYMVDECNVLLAIWNRTSGGTANCVRYGVFKKKDIVITPPAQFAEWCEDNQDWLPQEFD